MDFNTKQAEEAVAHIAALIGDLVVAHIQKEEAVSLGDIE